MARLGGILSSTSVDTSAEVDAKLAIKADKFVTVVGGTEYPVDGVADNVQIQAALDAVYAAGGGTVALLDKTYVLENMITLKPGVSLVGRGIGQSVITLSPTFVAGVGLRENTQAGNDIEITGITFDFSGKSNVGYLHIYEGNNVNIHHNEFKNMNAPDPGSKWGVRLGHYVDGQGATTQSQNVRFCDNIMENSLCGTFEQLLYINQAKGFVNNNVWRNNTNSLAYELMVYINCFDNEVSGNVFDSPSANSIGIMESRRANIHHNQFNHDASFKGVTIINSTEVNVESNVAYNSNASSNTPFLEIFDRALGPDGFTQLVGDSHNIVLRNNIIRGFKHIISSQIAGTQSGSDYTMNLDSLVIEGNAVYESLSSPIILGTDNAANNMKNVTIRNNNFYSWVSGVAGAIQLRGYSSGVGQMNGIIIKNNYVAPPTDGGSNGAVRVIGATVREIAYNNFEGVGGGITTASGGVVTSRHDNAGTYDADEKARTFVTVARNGSNADYIADGVADEVEIQAAIDAVNAAGGGTVFIRKGTYNTAAEILMKSNVELVGESKAQTIIKGAVTDHNLIKTTISGTTKTVYSNIAIKNLALESRQGSCMVINNTNGLILENLKVYFTVTTPIRQGIYLQHCKNVVIRNNTLSALTGNGISVTATDNFTIADNIIEGNATTDDLIDVDIDFSDTILIPSNYGTIIGNVCRGGARGNGIRVESSNYITVTGNTVTDQSSVAGSGIIINQHSAVPSMTNVVVSNNSVSNCAQNGIYTSGAGLTNILISNNTITNCGQNAGTNVRAGIQLSSPGVVVTGNTVDGTAKTGADGGAIVVFKQNNQIITNNTILNSVMGIRAWNGDALQSYTGMRITGNTFRNNTTNMLISSLSGKNSVRNQEGLTGYTVVTVGTTEADYITDGTADDVQIQAAINAVAAAGGGIVNIKQGLYRIAATIVMPFDAKVRVVGEKFAKANTGGAILQTATSVTLTNMFEFKGNVNPSTNADLTHDIAFENLTINGNLTTTNNFFFENFDYVKFDTCRIISATNSIKTSWNSTSDPVSATLPGGIFLSNCIVSANGGIGIDLQYNTQCWITNTWFSGTSVDTWINMKSSNKIHISNNEFNTATTAIRLQDTATASTQDITVNNNTFVGGKAITEERTHASSNRVTFVGNTQVSGSNDTLVGSGNVMLQTNGFSLPGGVFTSDITVPDEAYGSGWNGSLEVPTKNAIYDKIESLVIGGGTGDVGGPASSTDNGIVRFDGTTGKTIQNTSGPVLADDGRITTVTDPTGPQDVATKAYLEATVIAFATVL